MTDSKHTPGPWIVDSGSVYTKRPNNNGQFPRIAKMDRDEDETTPTERDNNAQLIAAAPDLLEALRDLLTHGMYTTVDSGIGPYEEFSEYYHKAKAAIARATGQA